VPAFTWYVLRVPPPSSITRRAFLALAGALPFASALAQGKRLPVGIQLFSLRGELAKDLMGSVRAVAKMGYEVVEFYSPYYSWTTDYAKDVRKLLDDLGIRCLSTHNGAAALAPAGLPRAIELNQIIGSRTIVMASPPKVAGADGWKSLADQLSAAAATLQPLGMTAGYHNHQADFVAVDGLRPIDILAAGTPKTFAMQLDVGWCLAAGADPVAFITGNPGRTTSLHCKDWAPGSAKEEKGMRVLVGEGIAPWKDIFQAAETVGGAQYYLIEQEGSRFSELETAQRCIAAFKQIRG
jgi:sugar phosphate isomerase/epimerase